MQRSRDPARTTVDVMSFQNEVVSRKGGSTPTLLRPAVLSPPPPFCSIYTEIFISCHRVFPLYFFPLVQPQCDTFTNFYGVNPFVPFMLSQEKDKKKFLFFKLFKRFWLFPSKVAFKFSKNRFPFWFFSCLFSLLSHLWLKKNLYSIFLYDSIKNTRVNVGRFEFFFIS